MQREFYYDSCARGRIYARIWEPDSAPAGIVQIVHGICEHMGRYEEFSQVLCDAGYLVVGEDHMGHGHSVEQDGIMGYFHGGWFSAVEDTYRLYEMIKQQYPDTPYFLFGHSMGSFMARTLLVDRPDMALAGCILCGTCWMPEPVLLAGQKLCELVCRRKGEQNPSERLQKMVFGTYNLRVEHPRTPYDWTNRSSREVDAYFADPLCGFTVTAGLMRDMLTGLIYIQQTENLNKMNPNVPILFIAGGDDPVGSYGDGVQQTAEAFKQVGMEDVSCRIYPLCRHELLRELNKQEVFQLVLDWMKEFL